MVLVRECHQVQKLLYMLGQAKRTVCFRKQHVAGDKGRVLIYFRNYINYDQTASKRGLQKAILVLAQVQLAGQIVITSWNSFSSTETFNFTG